MQYWYNVRTNQVEEDDSPDRDRSENLMGPYPTREAAEQALAGAAARTQAWDEEEEAQEQARREAGEVPWHERVGQALNLTDADDEDRTGEVR